MACSIKQVSRWVGECVRVRDELGLVIESLARASRCDYDESAVEEAVIIEIARA